MMAIEASSQNQSKVNAPVNPKTPEDPDQIREALRALMPPMGNAVLWKEPHRKSEAVERCRIVLLEDDLNLSELLLDYLSAVPEFEAPQVFRECGPAVKCILATKPHIALIDLRLNGESGLDCLRELRRHPVATRLIAFTSLDDESTVLEAFRAGADGYLVKQQSLKTLAESLLNCVSGRPLVSDAALAAMVKSFHAVESGGRLERLTPKEREVLDLTDRGHSCKEIAERLGVSLNTVYVHNKRILRKLKVGNRYAATFLLRSPMEGGGGGRVGLEAASGR
jgi:DNA-binding NarL/FixJ family response regulator